MTGGILLCMVMFFLPLNEIKDSVSLVGSYMNGIRNLEECCNFFQQDKVTVKGIWCSPKSTLKASI